MNSKFEHPITKKYYQFKSEKLSSLSIQFNLMLEYKTNKTNKNTYQIFAMGVKSDNEKEEGKMVFICSES